MFVPGITSQSDRAGRPDSQHFLNDAKQLKQGDIRDGARLMRTLRRYN